MSGNLDRYLTNAGIWQEHSICDTPKQLRVAKQLNQTLAEGITTTLSQSGLTQTWWEDAAAHFLSRKIRLLLSVTNHSPYELLYGKKPLVDHLQPFGCLAYVHLQKDQHSTLLPHMAQCIFISYPTNYKGWHFYNPATQKEIISDSAVFCKSVFPFWKPGLSAVDKSTNPSLPTKVTMPAPPTPEALSIPHPLDDLLPNLTKPTDATLLCLILIPCFQPFENPAPPPPVNLPK